MADLKRSLKEAVRKLAYSTSVDQLKKKGVNRVNVLGLDRIVQLIEEAVHRSLRHRLLSTEREAVVDATKEEFLRLLKSNEELRARHVQAEEEANNLRLELQRLRQELDRRLDEATAERRATYEGENAAIVARLQTVFEHGGELSPEDLQERILGVVMEVVDSERRDAVAAQEAARDREIQNLQRRINKLNQSLVATEQKLGEVSAMKQVDTGIASIYREVQGLGSQDGEFSKKKELMAGIFAANLKMQKGG